jgi:hypothetical protein
MSTGRTDRRSLREEFSEGARGPDRSGDQSATEELFEKLYKVYYGQLSDPPSPRLRWIEVATCLPAGRGIGLQNQPPSLKLRRPKRRFEPNERSERARDPDASGEQSATEKKLFEKLY